MKVGVVGFGYWGPNIVRNFIGHRDIRLVACWDRSKTQMKRAREKFSDLDMKDTYEQLLEDKAVEAVAIVTPISTHFELAQKALEAGKHVLVEKPLTAGSKDAETLIRLAQKKKKVLMVDHTFLYTDAVMKIKQMVDAGSLGALYYFDSVRVNLGLFQHDTNVIWDLAPHDISIMLYLVKQRPIAVSAQGMTHFNSHEDVAYLTVHFDAPLIAHFHVNWLSPVKVRKILLGGSKNMIVYDDMEASEKVKVYDRGVEMISKENVYQTLVQYRVGDMYAPKIDQTEALNLMVTDFVSAIKNGTVPVSDSQLGLDVVRILEASDRSLKESGKIIEL